MEGAIRAAYNCPAVSYDEHRLQSGPRSALQHDFDSFILSKAGPRMGTRERAHLLETNRSHGTLFMVAFYDFGAFGACDIRAMDWESFVLLFELYFSVILVIFIRTLMDEGTYAR